MKIAKAILFGSMVWFFVITAFTLLSFVPGIKDSEILQGIIIGILLIPFASIGAALYYRKGNVMHGSAVAFIMVSTALLLDIFITVPLVEIPYNGSSYQAFFTNPLLWILVAENLAIVYFYWRWKVKPAFT